jgi:SynChlorMet cassette protein ScmD
MSISPNPIANPICVLREEFDDWAVLFNPDTADAAGINPVGVAIWKLMDGNNSLEEIAAKINELFDNVPGTATEEITLFVNNLAQHGFVGYELASSPQ